jgi:sigma-E factor negative regulatory protein RseB
MIGLSLRYYGLPLLLVGFVAPARAADPESLLVRMNHAAHSLNYQGVFVYQRGNHLQNLRIVHKVSDGNARERLESLNGAPREVIRTEQEVRCYLPDENAVMIEHRRADSRNFPALLPASLSTLQDNYTIRRGQDGRVAGRRVLSVTIQPKDAYRYGYQLWADEATGLLLKATLHDGHGTPVEQYMFAQVTIGGPIPESELSLRHPSKHMVTRRVQEPPAPPKENHWAPEHLPPGFVLTARMMHELPAHPFPVEHLVYSDGLAVVSVFVEPVNESSKSFELKGLTQMGAVHAFGKMVDSHQVTVVGEVPAATVDMIGNSVASAASR